MNGFKIRVFLMSSILLTQQILLMTSVCGHEVVQWIAPQVLSCVESACSHVHAWVFPVKDC